MVVASSVAIELELDCPTSLSCIAFAKPLLAQLVLGDYDECSVLDLELEPEWLATHRTARRRARHAHSLGYRFAPIVRSAFVDDVFAINTSLPRRQGRPMSAGYRERPIFGDDVFDCDRHGVHAYGVLKDGTLVAYAWIYRSGELALVSQILGHGDHLAGDVMYLLARGVIQAEATANRGGFLVYNRHDSGTDGLRYFKEKTGFEPRGVEWLP